MGLFSGMHHFDFKEFEELMTTQCSNLMLRCSGRLLRSARPYLLGANVVVMVTGCCWVMYHLTSPWGHRVGFCRYGNWTSLKLTVVESLLWVKRVKVQS